jgi:hypothetical protein
MRALNVSKHDLRVTRVVDMALPGLIDGAARLRVDLFALTSNNLTYAAMGSGSAGYWDFFPGSKDWGRPPAWGFGTVVASRAGGVDEGARYFGFFPISETLDVVPSKASVRGFTDSAPHRAGKAAVYNQYVETRADPAYDAAFEREQALVRPLYASGWWTADRVHQDRPATVLISSASSKTAMAAAHRLRRQGSASLVALTSARHKAYVEGTGLYDRAHAYDDLAAISVEAPAVYVDFLGREDLMAGVHRLLGASLQSSILVGATDWAAKPGGLQRPGLTLPGPAPELLFVPEYAPRRLQAQRDLGAALLGDLRDFVAQSRALFVPRQEAGEGAITRAWGRLAAGETAPYEGWVLSF